MPAIVSSITRISPLLSCRMVSIKSISATMAARCMRNAASCSAVRVAHVSAIWPPIVIACAAGSTASPSSGPSGAPFLTASTRDKPALLANAVCDTKPPGDVAATPTVTSRYEAGVCGIAAPLAPPALPPLPPPLPFFRRGDLRRPGDAALLREGDFRPGRGGVRHDRSSSCTFGVPFLRAVAFTLCLAGFVPTLRLWTVSALAFPTPCACTCEATAHVSGWHELSPFSMRAVQQRNPRAPTVLPTIPMVDSTPVRPPAIVRAAASPCPLAWLAQLASAAEHTTARSFLNCADKARLSLPTQMTGTPILMTGEAGAERKYV
eukprot:COSAG02_NODE_4782_length_4986_cov_7.183344_3_plen_321_part_00